MNGKFLVSFVLFGLTVWLPNSQTVKIVTENLGPQCDLERKCNKPDPKKINVHLVPHTHDDVGWLNTVDQYYYGLHTSSVQYIIDTVIEELVRDKNRRFIYVEMAFFWKWWKEQNNQTRAIVKDLVNSGQLEFVNGGWTMPDEATTHYNSIIDQTSWGLKRLNDTFGQCGHPRVTWQIDPFGHSREIANLYALMGYEAVYFAREDYQDHDKRRSERTMEHVWQGSDDLGQAGNLFTGLLERHYSAPPGFNFDLGSRDIPIIDNRDSEEYNADKRRDEFIKFTKDYAKNYATNNFMFTFGDDFQYQAAHTWFKNMDKLIKLVNEADQGIKIFYSTPSCYTKALHDLKRKWTSKNDDFFPYASWSTNYWTGFYSSRPALKRMERYSNNVLQACKQLSVLAGLDNHEFDEKITKLREAQAVMQHHDAITGTEKQHVANNYAKLLHHGIKQCQSVIAESFKKLTLKNEQSQFKFCDKLNISSCDVTESGNSITVTLYNPLGHALTNHLIRLPVKNQVHYTVLDAAQKNKSVPLVFIPIPNEVQKLPGRKSDAKQELFFRANIPALGLVKYYLIASKNTSGTINGIKINQETKLSSKTFSVLFDKNGKLSQIEMHNGIKLNMIQTVRYYHSDSSRSSGAYLFRPSAHTDDAALVHESYLFVDKNTGIQEVHQSFNSKKMNFEQVIRIDAERDIIEFEWLAGPINVDDGQGKDVTVRYETSLNNKQVFYTDANGRQLLRRVWDKRPTWNLKVTEPRAGNFYPLTSTIAIKDEAKKIQMTVLIDRAQGGTSVHDGMIELMIHRRLLHDDGLGVGEALNEPGVNGHGLIVRGRHWVSFDTIAEAPKKHRKLAHQLLLEPIISFVELTPTNDFKYNQLIQQLPDNIHLLTLEKWTEDHGYLLRLENYFQTNETSNQLAKPVTINLKNLFKSFEIIEARELTLAANQDVSVAKNRLKFDYNPVGGHQYQPPEAKFDAKKLEVTLNPMEIRTFLIQIKRNT